MTKKRFLADVSTSLTKYLPEFVYGGIDGLVTTFAVVAGSTGANLPLNVVLILGFANLFADGFSMSVGAYMAEKAEHDTYHKHIQIEKQKIAKKSKAKIASLRNIYEEK